jgi:N-acetyllactosaminide 3-alpha-galactosyltransferase/rhamnosyl/mannosyltransferase
MKRILHISKYYYPFRGGTEQIAQDCVSALKNTCEQKVICFNHEKGDNTDNIDGVDVIRAGCFMKVASQSMSFSYGKLLKKTINDFKPDIIIFHYPNPFVAHYLLKYIEKKTQLIIYWHLDIVKQKILKKFFGPQNKNLIARADKIWATSPNYIEGSYWLTQVKEKCSVVPNCINVDRFKTNSKVDDYVVKIKQENKGKIICLAVGRHTEYKGFTYLIQASKYLDNRFKIFITGNGELTDQLKKEAEGDNKITFLGLVSDIELQAYLSAMDIFCFSSITKNEAFGLALAEAMYHGKPPVTFTIEGSGVNYVSLNEITGIEVPNKDVKAYADAMVKLADNPELREKYGKAAKQRVMDNFLNITYADNIRKAIETI